MLAGAHPSGQTPSRFPPGSSALVLLHAAPSLLGAGCFSAGFAPEAAGSGSPGFPFSLSGNVADR